MASHDSVDTDHTICGAGVARQRPARKAHQRPRQSRHRHCGERAVTSADGPTGINPSLLLFTLLGACLTAPDLSDGRVGLGMAPPKPPPIPTRCPHGDGDAIMLGLNWPWWFRAIDRTITAALPTIVTAYAAVPFYRRLDRIRRDLDEDRFARDRKPRRFLDEVSPAPLRAGE
jgi:hypothetical protein